MNPRNDWQRDVEEFHRATKQPIGIDAAYMRREMRAKLIMEEAVETVAAMGFAVSGVIMPAYGEFDPQPDNIASYFKHYQEFDLPDYVDGLCDLVYVTVGGAVDMGLDLDPHFELVHDANMRKLAGPKREDGKQLKPEGWVGPDHGKLLGY